ncbi:DUF2252 domain-containing protein [Apilactobacillus kunkeei]|uniref:DUF2252 domain-containing protein n=1 Tax=Apilactobacillus kunkeei TaxID=148814 RepID=UPI00136221CD|nr:DUF2252 domain-containing protein [Apilactobacillus kunkeei]MBI0091900.1 DUF2252 domain-containing protein [Lactobacillus sp. M0345]MCX0325906.1 DUF2252 domain-containing protein [Apilactobacillus kunkeei]NBI01400.1 DUF2252 domain-containing protein [Apilactobacillus kunkeei]UZX33484.1 DUF2252 domain-containing protein [Apilactobacillus kunkeei]WJV43667.1 DUF2252 domain-containing protein [Apilactobacillus kunkeei]
MSNKKLPYNFDFTDISMKTPAELIVEGNRLAIDTKFDDIANYKVKQRDVLKIMKPKNDLLYKDLLETKRKRMSKSPFSFFRGSVDIMNYDLNHYSNTGIKTLIGGDAHLGNFGYYGSSEGQLLFDMNDFDESHIDYWEYDVKRLLVSALLVAKQQDFKLKKKVEPFLEKTVKTYLKTLKYMSNLTAMERFITPNTLKNISSIFSKIHESKNTFDKSFKKIVSKTIDKAINSNSDYAVKKYTTTVKGQKQFIENDPVTVHVGNDDYEKLIKGYAKYLHHSSSDIKQFLLQFHIVDIVRHTVGVGSVGTLCYLILLENSSGDNLVLQVKQGLPLYQNDGIYIDDKHSTGEDIMNCQLILQSASDPFLGYFNIGNNSFYVRQFKDMKGSVKLKKLDYPAFCDYVNVCISLLARAHSQSPTFYKIIGYLESKDWIPEALVKYSTRYVKQVELDFKSFTGGDKHGNKI